MGGSDVRVTGGRLRGRTLRAPRGAKVRPTSDRVRESIFARLGDLEGARVVDLFAGTGALGIEALSRGAASAVFVERAAQPLSVLRRNLSGVGLDPVSRVVASEVRAALPRLAREGLSATLVFMDPPYADPELEEVMRAVAEAGILAPEGLLVVESAARSRPGEVAGLALLDERRYGDTLVLRYTRGDDEAGGET